MNMTQFSGPTSYTGDAAARHQSLGLLSRLTDHTNLVDLIAEDTTLARDQNISAKESSLSILNAMKIPGGVSYTTFQMTQKGRDMACKQREGKDEPQKKQEEDHCHEHHHDEGEATVSKS
jgi:hypothetical protein